jgi:hypothetical protein
MEGDLPMRQSLGLGSPAFRATYGDWTPLKPILYFSLMLYLMIRSNLSWHYRLYSALVFAHFALSALSPTRGGHTVASCIDTNKGLQCISSLQSCPQRA